ncbi:MAG: undecaprenyldiphospho-muramoylpentapeptide beta-N-acetylglucosaminyltransferase [Marinobacter sp.]|nr:undecaprenyldiphospho-muramoylpentapeptide beta-N-acetylglucosaminyltransferase [Marinobacter sp.]
MSTKRFLVMAGGTGGHVFPALATAERLRELGHEVHWLGARGGMEETLIGQTDIPLSLIAVTGLRGKGLLTLLAAPFKLLRALAQAHRVVRQVQPDCVIGMGGFVTGPGGMAARIVGCPLVIHEQNAVAGLTNRLLSRMAKTVMEAFPGSFEATVVTRCTGNPVRQDVAELAPPQERLAVRKGPVRLLVLGGSLGAQAINTRLPDALAAMDPSVRPVVRHQCGRRNIEETEQAYEQAGITANIEPFITDMAEAYAWADLVVCRAGALTIAELCAAGLGAVLVPFPQAVDDHQTRNGEHLVKAGAALMLQQSALTTETLAEALTNLVRNRGKLLKMAEAARSLARPDATERVVNYCLEAANA